MMRKMTKYPNRRRRIVFRSWDFCFLNFSRTDLFKIDKVKRNALTCRENATTHTHKQLIPIKLKKVRWKKTELLPNLSCSFLKFRTLDRFPNHVYLYWFTKHTLEQKKTHTHFLKIASGASTFVLTFAFWIYLIVHNKTAKWSEKKLNIKKIT